MSGQLELIRILVGHSLTGKKAKFEQLYPETNSGDDAADVVTEKPTTPYPL